MTELQGVIGFEGIGINAWMVWVLPFIGAALIPAIAKARNRIINYVAVGFALASAISAATLLPLGIEGGHVHSQINWIPILNIQAGTLADSLSIIMTNIVAWISFLIFVYSVGYMHGDKNLTRYWFFMLFFIGSMQ
jgi:NADH-quinone oxidoreductase subunit L